MHSTKQRNHEKSALMRSLVTLIALAAATYGQFDYEKAPILYGEAPSTDRIAALAESLEKGETQFTYDAKHGWLPEC